MKSKAKTRHEHGPRTSLQLSEETWPVFDRFFAANGGVWGGCWCTYYQMTGPFDSSAYDKNRMMKRKFVADGKARGTIVLCGSDPVGWCQFGPKEELPRVDTREGYVPTAKDAWRVTCFFIARAHRKQGFAEFALTESISEMKKQGVRSIEAYPVEGERSATNLWSGTPGLFEKIGFSRVGPMGKHSWVYSLSLSG
jgi:GNAT superfamily N-acetyltransferase